MSRAVRLEDVHYFLVQKTQCPQIFNLAHKVLVASSSDSQDFDEIQRRLLILTKSSGNEHLRKCADFMAEVVAYNELTDKNKNPRWVPETKNLTPDIQFTYNNRKIPVEVKHLNSPREEHDALASGEIFSGMVNPDYDAGIKLKISYLISKAEEKFVSHNKLINGIDNDDSGMLYLLFSKSVDADITDKMPGHRKMEERVNDIAESRASENIDLIIKDIDAAIINPAL